MATKYMLDLFGNLVYRKKRCYMVNYDDKGIFILDKSRKVYLEPKNTKIMENKL